MDSAKIAGYCAWDENEAVFLRRTAMSINTIQSINQIATNPRVRIRLPSYVAGRKQFIN